MRPDPRRSSAANGSAPSAVRAASPDASATVAGVVSALDEGRRLAERHNRPVALPTRAA